MERLTTNRVVILIVVLGITAVFLYMIRDFLMAIFLSAIFSSLARPLYIRIEQWVHGRKNFASFITIAIIFLLFFIPLTILLVLVANEGVKISTAVKPWVDEWINKPNLFEKLTQYIPQLNAFSGYHDLIVQKAGEGVGKISNLFVSGASFVTLWTVNFVFQFFIFLYSMFFFLKQGNEILSKFIYYLPLPKDAALGILEKFKSVSRAAIKGTLVIGIVQGTLQGMAFWVLGIESAIFWGTIMTFASIIPIIGTAIVWFPAVIMLAVTGHMVKAVILLVFCSLVVGSIDNMMRPWLVGRDTEMHELMILFSTLGGLTLFGILGFIIGPIIASLFITAWDIYATSFDLEAKG
jgi:predicted PurR-regulated permease PerM